MRELTAARAAATAPARAETLTWTMAQPADGPLSLDGANLAPPSAFARIDAFIARLLECE